MNYKSLISLCLVFAALLSIVPTRFANNQVAVHGQPGAILEVWSPTHHSSNITDLSLTPPSQLTIAVNVTGAGQINAFDVTMNYYNLTIGSAVLNATGNQADLSGSLFENAGCSSLPLKNQVDIPEGKIRVAQALLGCYVEGTGTLFKVTFDVVGVGTAAIDIVQTDTSGHRITLIASAGKSVPYDAFNAYFRNKPGIPPVAFFSFTPFLPQRGDIVRFNATSSYDPNNSTRTQFPNNGISAYLWSFGDGTGSLEGSAPSHVFISPPVQPASGNFTVRLIVRDFNDGLASRTISIVRVGSQGTIHDVAVSLALDKPSYFVGDLVTVTARVENHGNNNELVRLVVTADLANQTLLLDSKEDLSIGASLTLALFIDTTGLSIGPHTVQFKADILDPATGQIISDSNPFDNTKFLSFTLTPATSLPVASFTFTPRIPIAGDYVFFDGSSSFDPDGFVTTWFWDFGDGFTVFGSGIYHSFSSPGDYNVTLVVTDNVGARGLTSAIVHVIPRPAHDVSVDDIDVYPSVAVSSQFVNIVAYLRNKGLNTETVSLTAYYDSQEIATRTGIVLFPSQYANYVSLIWDTSGVPAGNHTISATVFLSTDENPDDNSLTDGTVTILPPPTLTLTPSTGSLGTKVLVHGSGFPPGQNQFGGLSVALVSFDDQFLGFAIARNGSFDFTFNVPHAEPGPHTVKALDALTGVRANGLFTVLPEQSSPTAGPEVNIDVGVIYFPGDTAPIYVLVSEAQGDVTVQITLYKPGGTTASLTATSLGGGLYKASYTIPGTGSLGTYALVATARLGNGQEVSGLASFEVKPSWIVAQGPRIASATALAGVGALVVFAWRKGYFKRRDENTFPV